MNFSDSDFLKQIVRIAFPGYRGRKIKANLCRTGKKSTLSYWDGGSRDEFVIVNLKTMTAQAIAGINPLNPPANWREPTVIPEDCCIVEHSIFRGKDAGCTVHYAESSSDASQV